MGSQPGSFRLLAPFVLVVLTIAGLCGGVVYWAGQQAIHLQQVHDLNRLTQLVRPSVANSDAAITPEQKVRLDDFARVLDTRVTIIAGSGVVLYDSQADPAHMANHNDRPEVIDARQSGFGSSIRFSDTISEQAVYFAMLVDPNQPNGVIVRLSYPRRTWPTTATSVWNITGVAAIAALLVSVLLSRYLRRQWVGPIRSMASATQRMAAGEWQTRVEPQGAEELRAFASKLNAVASQAQQQLSDLRKQRADLQRLVDTLPDPIFACDGQGRIILTNFPAATLLQVSPAQALRQRVVNVVSDEPILEFFELLQSTKHSHLIDADPEPTQREIRLLRGGQRLTYEAFGTRTIDGGVLLVFRDVSSLSGATQMKTDFVANASHELRTPIAAIKIAFETLGDILFDEDRGPAERCMTIIDGHLKRLEEMLRDLLDLSRVESQTLEPQVTLVQTSDLFGLLRATMLPVARQKGVDLILTDQTPLGEFISDARLLNLILKNLVENSVKFTPAGGKVTVTIRAAEGSEAQTLRAEAEGDASRGQNGEAIARGDEDNAGVIILSVSDTGIGIAPEHIDRVFERFYQVDAARSGSAGRGTGLGLAIVKHAAHALNGNVRLQSVMGQGTTVTCTFVQAPQAEASESEEAAANGHAGR